ncbi:glycoside hydrolase [Candidatus Cetobacterium colombiensis]|uniref:Glycoside hydrolase n=1 Tax=Candidatus Cetobacterium colombiensis TaxID=3073100 RepID=A0ABU4WB81_9FUSO|nr:glycoside hydrolase [Candidatus Cetobacterium colombiensis]MDX8336797.1 glycoside hydrolase [Candidatus Cetobacterium colombiensis]
MAPMQEWGEGASIKTLEALNEFEIDKAWIGFHNYTMGEINPEFIERASNMGYLVGAYDSYKSIHLKGKEKWNTASFQDKNLFENGTITLENGKKITGFNGVGRELNPKFSFDELNYRLNRFSKLKFNSWFVDTDAVGEVNDDFTLGNETDEEEQINQRIKRMDIIKDKYGLVIGSEDGDDFAASTIAYAHGIFTGIVPWWIYKDMKDPASSYFMGKYMSKDGGVPEYFEKEIILPEEADYLFYNEAFNIPLYQLVYNDSVIGTNHWIFHTLKIKNRQEDIMLRGILYNVPPVYHLDRKTLAQNKDKIVNYFKNFSPLHRKLTLEEMTGFSYLSQDMLVQKTTFSNGNEIIVNFSENVFYYKNIKVDKKAFKVIE